MENCKTVKFETNFALCITKCKEQSLKGTDIYVGSLRCRGCENHISHTDLNHLEPFATGYVLCKVGEEK